MINIIWCLMIIASVVYAAINGNISQVTDGIFDGITHSVELFVTLLGMTCFWNGIMNAASASGLVSKISKLITPLLNLLFPKLKNQDNAKNAISMNITANMMGMGNAATPFGLKAMKELSKLGGECGRATDEMVTFVLINTASIQIIPTGMAVLRTKYGSQSPMMIVPYVLITSVAALFVGLTVMYILKAVLREHR